MIALSYGEYPCERYLKVELRRRYRDNRYVKEKDIFPHMDIIRYNNDIREDRMEEEIYETDQISGESGT